MHMHTFTVLHPISHEPRTFSLMFPSRMYMSHHISELEVVDCFLFVSGPECAQTG